MHRTTGESSTRSERICSEGKFDAKMFRRPIYPILHAIFLVSDTSPFRVPPNFNDSPRTRAISRNRATNTQLFERFRRRLVTQIVRGSARHRKSRSRKRQPRFCRPSLGPRGGRGAGAAGKTEEFGHGVAYDVRMWVSRLDAGRSAARGRALGAGGCLC